MISGYFSLQYIVLLLLVHQYNCLIAPISSLYSPSMTGPSPLWYTEELINHASHLIRSYNKVTTGKELVSMKILERNPVEAARLLFFSETVVVSHGIQSVGDGPVLNYGNSAALKRWGASWEELTSMPSRYTAESIEREARAEFMRKVTSDGVMENYSGVRIGLDKSRFRIIDGTVWNIGIEKDGDDNHIIGQAAMFHTWEDL